MDDLGFSLKNLFRKKKKKKAAPPAAPFSVPVPTGMVPSGAPTAAVPAGGKTPGIAPTATSGWVSYLPYIVGGGVVLIGLVVIIRLRKKQAQNA